MDVGSQAATASSVPNVPPVAYVDPGSVSTFAAIAPAPSGAPDLASAPAPGPNGSAPPVERLSSAVSAIFAGSSADGVEVSLRVAHHPDEIIAVFRDARTGEVINQVPSETVVRLAEFFQQEAAGALLDRDA